MRFCVPICAVCVCVCVCVCVSVRVHGQCVPVRVPSCRYVFCACAAYAHAVRIFACKSVYAVCSRLVGAYCACERAYAHALRTCACGVYAVVCGCVCRVLEMYPRHTLALSSARSPHRLGKTGFGCSPV
jgi:hypothetical protein